MPHSYKHGELIWAKFHSYTPWPSTIVTNFSDVPEETKDKFGKESQGTFCVFFLGSKNYGFVPEGGIFAWDENFEEYSKPAKPSKQFLTALKEAKKVKEKEKEPKSPTKSPKKSKENKKDKEKKANGKVHDEKEKDKKEKEKKKKANGKHEEKEKEKEKERKEREKEERKEEKKREREKEKESKSERDGDEMMTPFKKRKTEKSVENEISNNSNSNSVPSTPTNKLFTSPPRSTLSSPDQNGLNGSLVDTKSPRPGKQMTQYSINNVMEKIIKHPILKYLKFTLVKHGEGYSEATAAFSDARLSMYENHACIASMHLLFDITCYFALLDTLNEEDTAITQDIHVSVLNQVQPGSQIVIKAKVMYRKDNLVFMDAEGIHNSNVFATAKVMKSLTDPYLQSSNLIREKDRDKEKQSPNNSSKQENKESPTNSNNNTSITSPTTANTNTNTSTTADTPTNPSSNSNSNPVLKSESPTSSSNSTVTTSNE